MNKILLKRLLFEVIEELILVEARIQSLENTVEANTLPYVKALAMSFNAIRELFWKNQSVLLKLFEDSPSEDADTAFYLQELFPSVRSSLDTLNKALYRLQRDSVLPETSVFLASLNLDKLLPGVPERVVLPVQDRNDTDGLLMGEPMLLSYLPVASIQAPLNWMGLLETFARHFSDNTLQVGSVLETLTLPEPKQDIIAPLLNLRLLGPGFYAYYVLNAFKQADAKALWVVEPILFQGLNRFGLVNKDLVILHQSIERGRQSVPFAESKAYQAFLKKADLAEDLLKVVEKVIPERLAYTEKSFLWTQLLQERLEKGVLISAIPMLTSPAHLRDELEQLEETQSVYPVLRQLTEAPASPREIINAGWFYKLDQSPAWLENAFNLDMQDGWDVLRNAVLNLDTLLLRSIEISEVHRMLAHDESDAMALA